MIELGKMNNLEIIKLRDFGAYLDGGESGEILLPLKYLPATASVGDFLDVFLYKDSEDRLIATNLIPGVEVGSFGLLEAVEVTTIGAFMDWGLEKDLLLPYAEQRDAVVAGHSYVVTAYVDNSGRLAASARIERYLEKDSFELQEKEEVELVIYSRTDIGFNAIINNRFGGLLYKNEIFKSLKVGDRLTGYIKRIREDGKVDLTLEKPGYDKIIGFSKTLLEELEKAGGFIELTDKSQPDEIYGRFGTSKKNFKKALGSLYKARKITIESNGIRIV